MPGRRALAQAYVDLWTTREKLQTQRLAGLKATLALAQAQYNRLKPLNESGAISRRTFLEATDDFKNAQEKYELGLELRQLAADASRQASERLRTL